MLIAYRIVYGVVLFLFLANVLKAIDFSNAPAYVSMLLLAAAASLCWLLILLFRFWRAQHLTTGIVVLVWEILFIWYSWLSPGAVFISSAPHVFQSLDPGEISRVTRSYFLQAGALFAALFLWFLSLPIVICPPEKDCYAG